MQIDAWKVACLDPALLWSRERIEKGTAYFFQGARGMRRHDGSRLDYVDTNMIVCGQLCMPRSFTREEIRIYPGNDASESAFSELIETSWLIETLNAGSTREIRKDLLVEHHIPLPEPARYKGTDRTDLVKEAHPMMEIVNGRHYPCVRVSAPLQIGSNDAFCMEFVNPALWANGLELYVVYVGKLWGPKSWLE